jgi:DNA-binding NtrC family response regulator
MDRQHYRVLVVDDDPIVRDVLLNILTSKGHKCDIASDGMAALDMAKEKTYACVVTDISMPHMNGIELTKQLLKLDPDVAILIITGFVNVHSDEEALNAGAADFIKKPFSVVEFSARFDKMMQNRETIAALRRTQREIEKEITEIVARLELAPMDRIADLKRVVDEISSRLRG